MAEKGKKEKKASQRDAKGRFLKQDTSTLPGTPFGTNDERAREAGKRSGAARREKADLRR